MTLDPGAVPLREVVISLPDGDEIVGDLAVPSAATGIVVFAHGSGSSRRSTRNRGVAGQLQVAGYATLLLDLLTPAEAREDEDTARYRFDIGLLTRRVLHALDWVEDQPNHRELPVGLFGASTGAAAALGAAARRPEVVRAVVSRGGRPDLTVDDLADVRAPTLLVVGGADPDVLTWNRASAMRVGGECEVHIVDGATHLFEEPGALREVAGAATEWFDEHLQPGHR